MQDVGIKLNEENILEKDNFMIPRQMIVRMTVGFGSLSKHPILQFVLSIFLSIVGLLPVYHFYLVEAFGGTFKFIEALAVSFFVIGIYLMVSCFRKGYYLDIQTKSGRKRMVFRRGSQKSDVENFKRIARGIGYPISS